MEQENKLIDQFHKNSQELIEVHITEFRGQEYVDVRIWTLPNPAEPGTQQPTKKGICISVDLLSRLISALEKAQESLARGPESDSKRRSHSGIANSPHESAGSPGA